MNGHFETLSEQVEDLRRFAQNPEQRIRTGYDALDYYIEGPAPGEVTTVLGRSYTGKSLMATDIIRLHPNNGSIFFSLEMSKRMALTRLFTQWSDFDADRVRTAIKQNKIPDMIDKMAEELGRHVIVDTSGLGVSDMMVVIEEYTTYFDRRPDFVQIDYLERVGGLKAEAAGWIGTEAAADQVKDLARVMDMPVFLYHQTNRSEPEAEPPTEKSARGGGYVEADTVLGMWNPSRDPKMHESERKALWNTRYFNVLKNRPIGKHNEPWRPLEFKLTHSLRFRDMSTPEDRVGWEREQQADAQLEEDLGQLAVVFEELEDVVGDSIEEAAW